MHSSPLVAPPNLPQRHRAWGARPSCVLRVATSYLQTQHWGLGPQALCLFAVPAVARYPWPHLETLISGRAPTCKDALTRACHGAVPSCGGGPNWELPTRSPRCAPDIGRCFGRTWLAEGSQNWDCVRRFTQRDMRATGGPWGACRSPSRPRQANLSLRTSYLALCSSPPERRTPSPHRRLWAACWRFAANRRRSSFAGACPCPGPSATAGCTASGGQNLGESGVWHRSPKLRTFVGHVARGQGLATLATSSLRVTTGPGRLSCELDHRAQARTTLRRSVPARPQHRPGQGQEMEIGNTSSTVRVRSLPPSTVPRRESPF